MDNHIRTVIRLWKTLVLFIFLTLFFYFGLKWMDQYHEKMDRYEMPSGGAVKVYQTLSTGSKEEVVRHMWPRMIEFLRNGE
ncbi:DUF4227 family protein [Sporolactobacillus sp. THM7-7]|nr:DUF4227 family protein [Sporolactobacillus sp. THM7-7]